MSRKLNYLASKVVSSTAYTENPEAEQARDIADYEYDNQIQSTLEAVLEVAQTEGKLPSTQILENPEIIIFSIIYVMRDEDTFLIDYEETFADILDLTKFYNLQYRESNKKMLLHFSPQYTNCPDEQITLHGTNLTSQGGIFNIIIHVENSRFETKVKTELNKIKRYLLNQLHNIVDLDLNDNSNFDFEKLAIVLEELFAQRQDKSYVALWAYDKGRNKWYEAKINPSED